MSNKKEFIVSEQDLGGVNGGASDTLLAYYYRVFGPTITQRYQQGGNKAVYDYLVATLGPTNSYVKNWVEKSGMKAEEIEGK